MSISYASRVLAIAAVVALAGQAAAQCTVTVNGTQTPAACINHPLTFSINPVGPGITQIRWFKATTPNPTLINNSSRITGATTATLTINGATTSDAGTYYAEVSGTCGTTNSPNFIASVNVPLPFVDASPSVFACDNGGVSLTTTQTGFAHTFRWFRGDTPLNDGGRISGATSSTLTINPVLPEDEGDDYRVEVINLCDANLSEVASVRRTSPWCSLSLQRIATGLSSPTTGTSPAGDYNRFFVSRQGASGSATIRVINLTNNTLQATPYLTLTGITTGGERGLLGLAFHPRFSENGYFFVHYTDANGKTSIDRYRANEPYMTSTTADAASVMPVLRQSQPYTNHNGGWIAFRPDDTQGYLYLALGDGGSGGDPLNNAQNINVVLGKILRLDIDGPDNTPGNADDIGTDDDGNAVNYTIPPSNPFAGPTAGRGEIFAVGVRNPWRNSFDRDTGDLWIGDVGQGLEEEIDFLAADAPTIPAPNFGWRCYEGKRPYNTSGCLLQASYIGPIFSNGRNGGCSITGGYVYRGALIPSLQGQYLFGDYCAGIVYTLDSADAPAGQLISPMPTRLDTRMEANSGFGINNVISFGEDADGEVYILDAGGSIYRIIDTAHVVVDCNANGVDDVLDISRGIEGDCDGDGVPNSCDSACCPACPADFDQDGGVTGADISAFFAEYEQGNPCADTDLDGGVTGADIATFFTAYEAGGC